MRQHGLRIVVRTRQRVLAAWLVHSSDRFDKDLEQAIGSRCRVDCSKEKIIGQDLRDRVFAPKQHRLLGVLLAKGSQESVSFLVWPLQALFDPLTTPQAVNPHEAEQVSHSYSV